jgi:hypothetical protein
MTHITAAARSRELDAFERGREAGRRSALNPESMKSGVDGWTYAKHYYLEEVKRFADRHSHPDVFDSDISQGQMLYQAGILAGAYEVLKQKEDL